MNTSLEQISWP